MSEKIRVLLADDHEIVRLGLTHTLKQDSRLEIVGEASNGKDALNAVIALNPDVLVLDITMPTMDGFEVLLELRKIKHPVKVLLLTMHIEEEMMERALTAGVHGYMLKNLPKEEIVDAIIKVSEGRRAIHETVFKAIGQKYAIGFTKDASGLTRREKEILKLIVDGNTSTQIADRLYISPRTVDTHRANMMQKLGIGNVAALVRWALDNKILAPTK